MLDDPQIGWTDKRVAELKQHWADGLSCSQIAIRMSCGFSRNAIIGKIHRLGLSGRTTRISTQQRYRSGPINYEERRRREAERLAQRMLAQAARQAARDARQKVRKITNYGSHMTESHVWSHVPVQEPEAAPDFLALTFNELQRDHCRYPRGAGEKVRFCGQPRVTPHSYCKHCYQICHLPERHRLPFSNREPQTLMLTAGKPSLQGLAGGESAA